MEPLTTWLVVKPFLYGVIVWYATGIWVRWKIRRMKARRAVVLQPVAEAAAFQRKPS